MPRYIEQLNECTDPQTADWLWIVDSSAASTDKDRKVAVGAFPRLAAANVFTATQIIPRLGSASLGAIADDGVAVYTPTATNGILIILGHNLATVSGVIMYRCGGGSQCALLSASAGTLLATTIDVALTGTTGADGKVTVSANGGDGKIYIENRRGAGNTTYSVLEIGL